MSDDNEIPTQNLLLVPVRTSSKAISEFLNRKIKTRNTKIKEKEEKYPSIFNIIIDNFFIELLHILLGF